MAVPLREENLGTYSSEVTEIIGDQEEERLFILFNSGKPSLWFVKAVVIAVVVNSAYFAYENCSIPLFAIKAMIYTRLQADTLTRSKDYSSARFHCS